MDYGSYVPNYLYRPSTFNLHFNHTTIDSTELDISYTS
jgi:hypothetical protein